MDQNTQKTSGIFTIRGSLDGEDQADFSEKEQFIGLIIEVEEFYLPISVISEIVMLQPITYVPQSDPYVEGVINLRGRIIPAVNLRRVMGLGRTEVTNSARVIIIKQNDFMWGLLVDGITYVTALAPHEIEEQNLTGKNAASDHITRIAKNKDKVVGIFDVNKIVAVLANGKDLFSAVEASHEEP